LFLFSFGAVVGREDFGGPEQGERHRDSVPGRNRPGQGAGDGGGRGRLAGQRHRRPPAEVPAGRAEIRRHPEEVLETRTNCKYSLFFLLERVSSAFKYLFRVY